MSRPSEPQSLNVSVSLFSFSCFFGAGGGGPPFFGWFEREADRKSIISVGSPILRPIQRVRGTQQNQRTLRGILHQLTPEYEMALFFAVLMERVMLQTDRL